MAIHNFTNCTVEVVSTITSVSRDTVDSGFDTEKKEFELSFRAKNNTPTTVGTLKFTADTGYRFASAPGMTRDPMARDMWVNGNLKAKVNSTTKDTSGNITSYLYDLVYTGKKNISKSNALRYNLASVVPEAIRTAPTGITRVIMDGKIINRRQKAEHGGLTTHINSNGDRRKVIIYGAPDTEFQLAITKFTDSRDSSDNITNSTEESLLSDPVNDYGIYSFITGVGDGATERYSILKTKIPSDGKYIFYQHFPAVTSETRYSINIKNSNLSTSFPTSSWQLSRHGWSGWYSRIMTQHINPKLTLRLTTDQSAGVWSIDSNKDGVYETFNSSAPCDITRVGTYLQRGGNNPYSEFTVTYAIKNLSSKEFSIKSSGGTTANPHGKPKFSNSDQDASAWTNSVARDNGGMKIDINNSDEADFNASITISTTSTTNDTATIVFNVVIDRYGTKDVIMVLDAETLLTQSS